MKTFDLRPAFKERPDQGQQRFPRAAGDNAVDNCVPTTLLACYQALTGAWPVDPEFLTDKVYGATYRGGEKFAPVVSFMRARKDLFPALPDVEVHDFGSKVPMDLIGEYGAQGFPMAASFYSDANGVILHQWSSILHASCPVASDGSRIRVWNAEGYEIAMKLSDFAAAFQGALVTFKRSVHQRPALIIPQEDDMHDYVSADKINADFPGFFDGQPDPSMAKRSLWVAAASDTYHGGDAKVRIYFVPAQGAPAGVMVQELELKGSEQKSIKSPIPGEQKIRAEWLGGARVDLRVYNEYLAG